MRGFPPHYDGEPHQIPPFSEDGQIPPQKPPVSKKQHNRVYGRVAYLFSAMFLALVGYMAYFQISLADELKAESEQYQGGRTEAVCGARLHLFGGR